MDDEPAILDFIKEVIEPLGYHVVTLQDGREAAQRLEMERFDGIVVDIWMPHLDGYELTRRSRASLVNGGTPVVMITGADDIEAMRKGFRCGVSFFLAKPFTPGQVCNLFTAVRGSMLRERRRYMRLPFHTAVQCVFGEHGEKRFTANSLNLGETGMLLEPSGGLEVGQDLILQFTLPAEPEWQRTARRRRGKPLFPEPTLESGPREMRAKVLRREPPDRMAVEFTTLSPEERAAIQRHVMGVVTS